MPDYPLTSERHPVNQERLIHQTALEVLQAGGTVPASKWNDLVALTLNVRSDAVVRETTRDMERRRMIKRQGDAIEILPREGVILPHGWTEPDTATATA